MEPLSILDLQKQISDLYKKEKNNRYMMALALVILLILSIIAIYKGQPRDPYSVQIQDLQTAIAIQRATDSIIVQTLQKQDAEDSMRTGTLLNEIARTQTTIANITRRYDKNRNTVSNLSDTDQLRLLSTNITTGH